MFFIFPIVFAQRDKQEIHSSPRSHRLDMAQKCPSRIRAGTSGSKRQSYYMRPTPERPRWRRKKGVVATIERTKRNLALLQVELSIGPDRRTSQGQFVKNMSGHILLQREEREEDNDAYTISPGDRKKHLFKLTGKLL